MRRQVIILLKDYNKLHTNNRNIYSVVQRCLEVIEDERKSPRSFDACRVSSILKETLNYIESSIQLSKE